MPEDSRIIKIDAPNRTSLEIRDTNITLEELDHLIREWVNTILSNIDPPPGLWERIKRQAGRRKPAENSCGS